MADTLVNPLQAMDLAALETLPRLGDVAAVWRGVQYKIAARDNAQQLLSDESKPGFIPGLWHVTRGFEPYVITAVQYLNPALLLPEGDQPPWEQPKVIVSGNRGAWTLVASLDERGLVYSQSFAGVWARGDLPIEVIAAVLNGLVANAFAGSTVSRRVPVGARMGDTPVPAFSAAQQQLIVSLVRQYRFYREQWLTQPTAGSHFERTCREIIERIDNAVLAAYGLPSALQRKLAAYFAGQKRPGPVRFDLPRGAAVPSRVLYGLWADLGPAPSAAEIDEARREAWAPFNAADSAGC